ncbi:MAG: hypothetical protein RL414_35 [Actinomycetota bacterium]
MTSRKDELASNLADVEARITAALAGRDRSEITLIVVTKTFTVEDARLLYDLGVRHFGENRDHEGAEKAPQLPGDAHWYFQGQIQGRKISSITEWASTILSLDSRDHGRKFAKVMEEKALDRSFFAQVNLEPERNDRGGVAPDQLLEFISDCPVTISGLMCVAPMERDPYSAFLQIRDLRTSLQSEGLHSVTGLSIGMSGDFEAAIHAGATHIRVGSSILGSRTPVA